MIKRQGGDNIITTCSEQQKIFRFSENISNISAGDSLHLRGCIVKKTVLLLFILLGGLTIPAFSQEEISPYDKGDQIFAINAGLFIPLFFQDLDGAIEPAGGHIGVGGMLSLEWGIFLNRNITLGFDVGGVFASTVSDSTLLMIPITAKISYIPRIFPFEFPIFLEAGVNLLKLDTLFCPAAIIKPGAAFQWNYNRDWTFGLNAKYWWVPEIYSEASGLAEQSRFGNFLEVTLSALYHF